MNDGCCQLLWLMLTLWIYLSLDLTGFWMFQDVKCDYTVDLTGTRDRSEYDIENY